MPSAIEDYALIGDGHTGALVGRDGSIDWLCLPRFDSSACFAALLGDPRHGRWQIAPDTEPREVRRRYREHSMVLETEFTTDTGRLLVTDAMPPREGPAVLIRRVRCLSGGVRVHHEFAMRLDYGRVVPSTRVTSDEQGRTCLLVDAGADVACLRSGTPGPAPPPAGALDTGFTLTEGQTVDFQCAWYASGEAMPRYYDTDDALTYIDSYWRWWASKCTYEGRYREPYLRSVLTLKALTYAPTGAVVAAVTTSLPEYFGGTRNWDYRYCWLRDAALTLTSMIASGYREEVLAWRDWLLRTIHASRERVQIMYRVASERELPERELPWLPGYADSRPVRIGNAATGQRQGDVIGYVMNSLSEARRAGIQETAACWTLQRSRLEYVEGVWRTPDQGLWEIRGEPRMFTHSKVMVWQAFDQLVRAMEEFELEGPLDRWRTVRDEIWAEIVAGGFDPELGSFTQYYGGRTLDASLLTLPSTGFIPADDPRMVGTVAAIERQLLRDGLVYRYDTSDESVDGLPAGEYPFFVCSFWLADYYARAGRLEEARRLLERLLDLSNDVHLFAEQYDVDGGHMAGNTPQALSHLGLIQAVQSVERAEAEARSGR